MESGQKNGHKHWSEQLADRVIAEKKEPYVITGGMTTSGPMHFGTLCEFLFPSVIQKAIEKRGKKCDYYFIADILDAFDSVPLDMEKYRAQLEPHLGKPLCNVPDPTNKSGSFGDHYLDEAQRLIALFGIDNCNIVRVNEAYAQGRFDEYALFYLNHEADTKRIVEETSGKQEKKDWSPIMPLCENCGKISTTRVIKHDAGQYEYACDKDVKYAKGCGHNGKNKISDHRYKIAWRLHWPAWKQIYNSGIEGAGIDHHTKGGSEDTCRAITLNLLKKDYHIPYRYGFILFQGRKYSKSKGTGIGVSDVVKLMPAEIIKYMLIRPDLEENIDINPTPENLLKEYGEFQQAAGLAKKNQDELSRAERKKAIAFSLSTGRLYWKVQFLDVLLYYQVYYDWKRVGELLDDKDGVQYLKPYVEEWIRREFIPDEYHFKYQPKKAEGPAAKLIQSLDEKMDPLAIHNVIFEFAKANGIEPKELFKQLYLYLIGKERGPRLGKLIFALGVKRLQKELL